LLRRGALAGSSRTCRVFVDGLQVPGEGESLAHQGARLVLAAGVVGSDQPGQGGLGVVGAHPDRVGQQLAFGLEQAAARADLTQGQVAGGGTGGGLGGGQVVLGAAQCRVRGGVDGCLSTAARFAGPDPGLLDRGADSRTPDLVRSFR